MKQPNVYIMDSALLRVDDDILENIPISRFGVSDEIISMMHLVVITNDEEFHVFKNRLDGTTNTQPIDDLPDFVTDFVNRFGLLYEDVEEYYNDEMDGDHATALASAGFGTDEDYGG